MVWCDVCLCLYLFVFNFPPLCLHGLGTVLTIGCQSHIREFGIKQHDQTIYKRGKNNNIYINVR